MGKSLQLSQITRQLLAWTMQRDLGVPHSQKDPHAWFMHGDASLFFMLGLGPAEVESNKLAASGKMLYTKQNRNSMDLKHAIMLRCDGPLSAPRHETNPASKCFQYPRDLLLISSIARVIAGMMTRIAS
jgi:hypothetical protein